MINVQKTAKAFGQRTLWSDLSFTVHPGEMVALVGPSGCGKSTLLNCLGLLATIDAGRILVDDQDITRFGAGARRRFRRDRLGYLFQNYALIENADIDSNLKVAVRAARRIRGGNDDLEAALRTVGLEGRRKELVYRLSGGEQQRLAVARLLLKKPTVVLADEPTGALDADNEDMVISLLRRMATDGCAVLIATHSKRVESDCDSTLHVGNDAPIRG